MATSCGYAVGGSTVRRSPGRSERDVAQSAYSGEAHGSYRSPSDPKIILVPHDRSRQCMTPASTRAAHSARSGPHKCLIRIGKSKSKGRGFWGSAIAGNVDRDGQTIQNVRVVPQLGQSAKAPPANGWRSCVRWTLREAIAGQGVCGRCQRPTATRD